MSHCWVNERRPRRAATQPLHPRHHFIKQPCDLPIEPIRPRRSMVTDIPVLAPRKRIALIAHDNKKPELLRWARRHLTTLARHELFATGTTGALLARELGLDVHRFQSGPLGGDQQVGAAIV